MEEARTNKNGQKLCNRCFMHPATIPGLPCHKCRVELLKAKQEITKPK